MNLTINSKYAFAFAFAGILALASFAKITHAEEALHCEPSLSLSDQAQILNAMKVIEPNFADDAYQHGLLKYYIKCMNGQVIENPAAWIMTVSKNKLFAIIRSNKTKAKVVEKAWLQNQLPEKEEFKPTDPAEIRPTAFSDIPSIKALYQDQLRHRGSPDIILKSARTLSEKLSEEHLQAMYLKYIDEKTYAEIAQIQNVPTTTVESRLHTGKTALAKVVTSDQQDQPLGWSAAEFWLVPGAIALLLLLAYGSIKAIKGWGMLLDGIEQDAARAREKRRNHTGTKSKEVARPQPATR